MNLRVGNRSGSKQTIDRTNVTRDASPQSQQALRSARKIQNPWSRCQALSHLAKQCEDLATKNRLLSESFEAALQTVEPNRVVTVSAWPLNVLCNSGQDGKLKTEMNRLLAILSRESSPVRRADALNMMLGAILRSPRSLFWQVFDRFQQACLTPLQNRKRNSKGESLLAHWVLVVDRFDAERAQELLEVIEGPVLRERALNAMHEHKDVDLERWVGWPSMT